MLDGAFSTSTLRVTGAKGPQGRIGYVAGTRAKALITGGVVSVAPLAQQTRMRLDFASWEP